MRPLWFQEDEGTTKRERRASLAERLDSTVTELLNSPKETERRSQMQYDLELYFGQRIPSLFDVGQTADATPFTADNLRFNHCYSACSTIRNRICSFRPLSEFIPSSGNALAKRGAEDLSAMNEAWSVEQGRQATMALWFRDLLTCDGAAAKIYRDGDSIDLGRFPPWEVLVDEVDGLYGKTSTIHHVQFIPLETASVRYGISVEDLRADAVTMLAGMPYTTNREVVRVADSYAAATGEDEPGRHVILVGSTHVALDDDWQWPDFPIVIGVFEEGMTGTWGKSAISMIRGLQTAQNEWSQRMENAHYLSSLQVWQLGPNEEGPSNITNADVRINRYTAKPADVLNPPPVGPEAYQYADLIEQQVYKTLGVSPFIAAGVKQPATTSGVAIDATSELQTDRLALLSQIWEQKNSDVDTWWMRLTSQAARDGVQFKWKAINKGAWKELMFEDGLEEWVVRPKPTSVFGQTVSARLTKATELLKAGAIDIEQWTEAVALPDLKPITDLRLADQRLMERIVDRILENGDLRMPGPYVNPQKMYEYARARYNLAEADEDKYSNANLSKLRRLIDAVGRDAGIIKPPAPPQPAAPQLPALAAAAPPLPALQPPAAVPAAVPPPTVSPVAPPMAPPVATPPAPPA